MAMGRSSSARLRFIHSAQEAAPYTGPSSFVWSNGQVSFRMSAISTAGNCKAPGAVSNWNQENTLRYQYTVSSGSCFTLKIFVNGIQKKSCSACDALTTSHFTNSAMWLGANNGATNHNAQSVNLRITQLRLTTPIYRARHYGSGRYWRLNSANRIELGTTSTSDALTFRITSTGKLMRYVNGVSAGVCAIHSSVKCSNVPQLTLGSCSSNDVVLSSGAYTTSGHMMYTSIGVIINAGGLYSATEGTCVVHYGFSHSNQDRIWMQFVAV